jgi:Ni,Fe-hydrogenase maturation factor
MRKSNKITIYIFGNPLLDFDNLPLKLVPKLRKKFPNINFIIQDPNENIKPSNDGELIIIDTVVGINKVTVINNMDELKTDKIYSMHDFDLAFNLKLLKKIGKLRRVMIFGVPPKINTQEALKQLKELITNSLYSSSLNSMH